MKPVNTRRWKIPFGFILSFLISEAYKYHPSRDPTQCMGLTPICFPISVYKLSWLWLLFMLTGAVLIRVPSTSYLELCKSSLSLCLSLSPIFINTLASHLFKTMASHVGLSPGQGTKMAHTMGQLSFCAATGEPVHLSEDTGQSNKQKTQTTTTKPTMASSARQQGFHHLAQSAFISLLNPFPHIHFKLIIALAHTCQAVLHLCQPFT